MAGFTDCCGVALLDYETECGLCGKKVPYTQNERRSDMDQEFIVMFETLMRIIKCKCDFGKEWDTGTECVIVGDIWERAEVLLNRTYKRLGSN